MSLCDIIILVLYIYRIFQLEDSILKIHILKSEIPFGSNSYLIETDHDFAVVDPSVNFFTVLETYPQIKDRIKYILLTHAHFDHIYYIDTWCSESAKVVVGVRDAKALADPYINCYMQFMGVERGYSGDYITVKYGDNLHLGDEVITILEVPGHTPGSLAFVTKAGIFVGDTLFAEGGYGRFDLPGGNSMELFNSINCLFDRFDTETFFPGHGAEFSINSIRKYFK